MAVHRITRGLDLPLAGSPAPTIDAALPVRRVAVLAADFPGLKPSLLVQAGDRVLRGTPLFEDKTTHGVRFTAPAAGTVAAIHRGDKRAFQSVVIDVGPDDGPASQIAFTSHAGAAPESLDAAAVQALLVESGLWTAFRTRPFSQVPAPGSVPYALFVTVIDTHPHAPSVAQVLAGREAEFAAGLAAVARLCTGTTHVCKAAGQALSLPPLDRVVVHDFSGPHPAGTPGLHIHLLAPVDLHRVVWHIGYQDVLAIGGLVTTGRLDVERVIALAGPGVRSPRLLRTRLGASTDELTRGELTSGPQRVISGSVLDGRTAQGEIHGYLGRYHRQVSVVPEATERELLGWIAPAANKYSIWGNVLGHWRRGGGFPLTTTTNGSPRAMVPIGAFERVMPFDLLPSFLLRALISGNVEWAEELGVIELDEEDLALCTFVCPGKVEYGPLLRDMLARIEKEHAHE